MFNVTETAQAQVAEYFKDKELKPIRIFLNQGCGGAQLAMAVDEQKESDSLFEISGIQYVIEQDLLEKAKPLEVDYKATRFDLSSSLKLESACGSCSSTGSCCS